MTSIDRTTHCEPYFSAPAFISEGSRTAPELTLTLSAPDLSTRSKSSREFMLPPTVRGMNISRAVRRRMSAKSGRPSALAVMS